MRAVLFLACLIAAASAFIAPASNNVGKFTNVSGWPSFSLFVPAFCSRSRSPIVVPTTPEPIPPSNKATFESLATSPPLWLTVRMLAKLLFARC